MQFGRKVSAHNMQELGAEFRPARGELCHLLHIPHGEPVGPRVTTSTGLTARYTHSHSR